MLITATLKASEHSGEVASNRKEDAFTAQYTVLDLNALREIVVARIYQTKARAYACVWVHGYNVHISGGGMAGGYGYHRTSQALQAALYDAGIVLSADIGGRGESAMLEALEAVAKAVGSKAFHILLAHA